MKKMFLLVVPFLGAAGFCFGEDVDSLNTRTIDGVVVQSFRTPMLKGDIPNVVEVITPGEMNRSTATSWAEMIKKFTPLESANVQGLNNGIEFRGFTATAMGQQKYTRLLTDGIPSGTRYSTTTFLTSVSSIELLKGPFSALYGSGAMGGVVNVLTPQSKGEIRGGADLSWGSFRTGAVSATVGGSISRKFDFDVTFDYFNRQDDYTTGNRNILKTTAYEKAVLDPNAYDTVYNNSTIDRSRAVVRLGYDLSEKWRLKLYNEIYYTDNAPSNGTLWGGEEQDTRVMRNYHRLDVTGREGAHAFRITPYVSFEKRKDWYHAFGNVQDKDYNTFGITAQDAITLGRGTLVVGVDNFSERDNSTNASIADGTPWAPYNPDYMTSQTGAFAQYSVSLFDGRLSGIAGMRYDNILFKTYKTDHLDTDPSSDAHNTFNPNVSLQYRPFESIRIHAGVGRAFLAPDAYKMTGTYATAWGKYRGNPDLKPETSLTWEAGAGYTSPGGHLQADLSVFFTKNDNFTVSQPDPADAQYMTFVNADKASIQGFEALASYDLGAALHQPYSWKFYASYSRIFHSEATISGVTSERPYLSRTKATFGTTFVYNKLSVNISGRYVGSKTEWNYIYSTNVTSWDPYVAERVPVVTPGGSVIRPSLINEGQVTTPDYMVFDASAAYRIFANLTLGVKADNILNELYMERDGYYMPGSNYSIHVSLRF